MNILFLSASVLFLLIFQKQAGEGLFKGVGGRRAGILFFNSFDVRFNGQPSFQFLSFGICFVRDLVGQGNVSSSVAHVYFIHMSNKKSYLLKNRLGSFILSMFAINITKDL